MADQELTIHEVPTMESGTYEVIRGRLKTHSAELQTRLERLNCTRKEIFGSIEMSIVSNERIMTVNNCTPRDLVQIGNKSIFGFNVMMGMKSKIELADVFAIFEYQNRKFTETTLALINNETFLKDFEDLYKYYKSTFFTRFSIIGPHLFMVFRTGNSVTDIKTFKWLIQDNALTYMDNRSDHEYQFPLQFEFEWKRTTRDMHCDGEFPHISINDRVFVETVGGDLTIKVENNTKSGRGIYSEDVESKDQKLDDAEIYYAIIGNIILIKIKPYQEKTFRYLVFNEKIQSVTRIDAIADACIILPDQQGLVFSNGYYLQSGEYKTFDTGLKDMLFVQKKVSPNGEDFQYIFFNRESGIYAILTYNLINQTIEAPIVVNGYTHFENGELILFRADEEPKKNHQLQIWQTPFTSADFQAEVTSDSFLVKVGNKQVVQTMAECQNVINLIRKEDSYANLYVDINKQCTEIIDTYFWIEKEDASDLKSVLIEIRQAAITAIDEFEKVVRIRKSTEEEIARVSEKVEIGMRKIRSTTFDSVDLYVTALSELRVLRGEIISLKELRYTNLPLIETLETDVRTKSDELSQGCIEYLLKPEGLDPYRVRVEAQSSRVPSIEKTAEGKSLEEEIRKTGRDLELLIEIVSNLKIDDPTQTTAIIDTISVIFSSLNAVKAKLQNRITELSSFEGTAEFNSQLKLLNQAVINYLDVADTPEKCDEYLTKLMVQVEELEGKFADFDQFIPQLAEKREELFSAFETKKLSLVEKRNKRAGAIMQASERIIAGIKNRLKNFTTINEINGYFATDLMIEKVRDNVEELNKLGDSVKADDLQSQIKSSKEEAVRQLKDKQELFEEGTNVVKFGKHKFSVNAQELDLTMVQRDDGHWFLLTGTDFKQKVESPALDSLKAVWKQEMPSENDQIYRSEYLAFTILESAEKSGELSELANLTGEELADYVQKFMSTRLQEGYIKGIHDGDTAKILTELIKLHTSLDLLTFPATARTAAQLFWDFGISDADKKLFAARLRGVHKVSQLFSTKKTILSYAQQIKPALAAFLAEFGHFESATSLEAAHYLCREQMRGETFVISSEASELYKGFSEVLKQKRGESVFKESLAELETSISAKFGLILEWLEAYTAESNIVDRAEFIPETAQLLLADSYNIRNVIEVPTKISVTGLIGNHTVVSGGNYAISYTGFMEKLSAFSAVTVTLWYTYQETKKAVVDAFRKELRLEEFRPRVLTSFVRNRLINEVYLPLIGDNFAKQIGTVGENKRTDLMGMLLLISPPGYGKTTIMEYIASRLGLIFMKINGPALGHEVTSLDPTSAPNAGAREEVKKLNLALEMGNNVMIYVDDIQHCNPEFLQKFISLCDGQRRIEGVYNGISRTYDLRGKKVAVVMAGNPYTESGEKFQIPDMLANRADTYNLGDMLSANESAFKLSYLENALTSNPIMNSLMTRSQKDVYTLIDSAVDGRTDGIDLEGNYSPIEVQEYLTVLKKMLKVRDVVLSVNMQYIYSAAQADEFRTEPSFKLQGSYRNMNKIAEKVLPVMNDAELDLLIQQSYENDSQTLTSGAEANLLKWKEIVGKLAGDDLIRWNAIKDTYGKNKLLQEDDMVGQMVLQMAGFGDSLKGIRELIATINAAKSGDDLSKISFTDDTIKQITALLKASSPVAVQGNATSDASISALVESHNREVQASVAPVLKAMTEQQDKLKKLQKAVFVSLSALKQLMSEADKIALEQKLSEV